MLTLRKIGSGSAAGYSLYLAGRADDEHEAWQIQGYHYTGDGAAGEWIGDASTLAALGVEQGREVERAALARGVLTRVSSFAGWVRTAWSTVTI